ncbi:MAG: response regulator transcription factor [Cytophagales bacterium]|nr:response regulator transcription factor [Cytophagales bacterium]
MEHETIKIILADDHELILDGLKLILDQDSRFEVIGEAYDGEELLRKIKAVPELDIVVLDINMPKKDGIQVTREIKATFPEVKVLILSMYNRKEFVKNLVDVGIDGYILKNAGKKELIKALETLVGGDPYYGEEITKTIMKSYQKNKVFDNPIDVELSEREKEIVTLIANEMTTAEIADKLFISVYTVDTHRKNILGKLGVKNAAGIMKFALQTGIIKGFDL